MGDAPKETASAQSEVPAGNGKPFEENMARLESLVRQLEQGELSLENALKCYQEGVALVGYCQQSIERTAAEVEILTESMK
jgi:exodeoxyribonuclease VII small subunit